MPASRRSQEIAIRAASAVADGYPKVCSVPGCGKPTTRAAGGRLGAFLCRRHTERLARHGSAWKGSYAASERRPFERAAAAWIKAHRTDRDVALTLAELEALLESAGPVSPASSLRGLPPARRAKIALARLRNDGVKPERLLAIYLGVVALIRCDPAADGSREFRLVQVAKAAHRLASGYHPKWEFPLPNGGSTTYGFHSYARSSGRVLRHLGEHLERCCWPLAEECLQEVIPVKEALSKPRDTRD